MSEQQDAPSRRIFAPPVTPETQRFWNAAKEGNLLFGFCNACEQPHYFPRSLCPFCFSGNVAWNKASGRATIYSYSIMRRSPGDSYVIAYVTLEEGPSLLTNIVDTAHEKVRIGAPVVLVFRPSEDGAPVPFFRVAERDSAPKMTAALSA